MSLVQAWAPPVGGGAGVCETAGVISTGAGESAAVTVFLARAALAVPGSDGGGAMAASVGVAGLAAKTSGMTDSLGCECNGFGGRKCRVRGFEVAVKRNAGLESSALILYRFEGSGPGVARVPHRGKRNSEVHFQCVTPLTARLRTCRGI